MSLPPLPKTTYYVVGSDGMYDAEQIQAYGQACREAALEEAAFLCEGEKWVDSVKKSIDYIRAFNEGCQDCEAAIRRLK